MHLSVPALHTGQRKEKHGENQAHPLAALTLCLQSDKWDCTSQIVLETLDPSKPIP